MKTTQVCPVCRGRMTVPGDFYASSTALFNTEEKCRSCDGKGYIVLESVNPAASAYMDKAKISDFTDRMDRLFEKKLQKKTGWGRIELLRLYRDCVNQILLEIAR